MAKQSGLGMRLFVAGYDLSGDIGTFDRISGGPTLKEVPSIVDSAQSRIGLRRDGGIEFTSYFNPTADMSFDRLSALPGTDVIVTGLIGASLGSPSFAMVAKQLNYDGAVGDDGSFVFTTEAASNAYGLQWGEQLTAGKRTDTTATNGTSLDNAASSALGLQAFLHVFAFTGTSVTVKVQHSTDNSTFADVTGGTFTAATGITSERVATAADATINRYLRVATTGTFSNAVFAVTVVRNATATVF